MPSDMGSDGPQEPCVRWGFGSPRSFIHQFQGFSNASRLHLCTAAIYDILTVMPLFRGSSATAGRLFLGGGIEKALRTVAARSLGGVVAQ